MTDDNDYGIPQVRYGPIQWLDKSLRTSIEQTISDFKGCAWRIKNEKDLSEFACHHCAIVSDDSFAVFFKYAEDDKAKQQFKIELSDLLTLSDKAGVLIPNPIGIVQSSNSTLLILEALEEIVPGPQHWRQMGAALARIHQVKSDSCGYETNGFCGPLFQDNTLTKSWTTFFRERRLLPRIKNAIDSENLPSSEVSKVETLITRLPELCDSEVKPSLLHGDPQRNNFINTAEGTYVIDPSVYYGNPEIDLATIDSWQPVPDDFFEGYREFMPIDSGFDKRRDLWRIPLYLAAVALEGEMHLKRLSNALQKYL